MTTDVEISKKSAGPAGATDVRGTTAAKIVICPFMLEDYIDAVIAHEALNAPENSGRIPWDELKEQLGL